MLENIINSISSDLKGKKYQDNPAHLIRNKKEINLGEC